LIPADLTLNLSNNPAISLNKGTGRASFEKLIQRKNQAGGKWQKSTGLCRKQQQAVDQSIISKLCC